MAEYKAHQPGTFCYIELATTDPGGAQDFYGELFGWQYDEEDMGENGKYTQFHREKKITAAMHQLTADQVQQGIPPHWGHYIAVDDVEASTKQATELGGTVIMGPFAVSDFGRMSILSDPTGAVFCIWQAGRNIGLNLKDEPGTLIWTELMTTDATKASAFYQGLFGWTPQTKNIGHMGDYTSFMVTEDTGAGGMMTIQPEMGSIPPNWMPYIAVESIATTHAQALELGAKSTVEPTDIPEGGKFAVLQDPQGAVFGIYRPQEGFSA